MNDLITSLKEKFAFNPFMLYFPPLSDVNECTTKMPCGQKCINTIGSFLCQCSTGYVLNANKISCDCKFIM